MARTVTAQDRRVNAVKDLATELVTVERGTAHVLQGLSRYDVATKIRALAPLGRTADWRSTVERWAADVEDPAIDMVHAVLQGQVYALHAA